MIDRDHDLPISRQAEALGVSRSAVYYKPRPTSAADLQIMRRIDELHLDYPFAGSRMLRDFLEPRGRFDRAAPCGEPDEADGDRGDLPPPEHQQTRAGPQDLSVSACAG